MANRPDPVDRGLRYPIQNGLPDLLVGEVDAPRTHAGPRGRPLLHATDGLRMNKWFRRAVGTVGVAGGLWLLGAGTAHADDSVSAAKDPQQLHGLLKDLFTPTGGRASLGLSLDTPGHRMSAGVVPGGPLATTPHDGPSGLVLHAPGRDGQPKDVFLTAPVPNLLGALPINDVTRTAGLNGLVPTSVVPGAAQSSASGSASASGTASGSEAASGSMSGSASGPTEALRGGSPLGAGTPDLPLPDTLTGAGLVPFAGDALPTDALPLDVLPADAASVLPTRTGDLSHATNVVPVVTDRTARL